MKGNLRFKQLQLNYINNNNSNKKQQITLKISNKFYQGRYGYHI